MSTLFRSHMDFCHIYYVIYNMVLFFKSYIIRILFVGQLSAVKQMLYRTLPFKRKILLPREA